jgi:hypothetical protein
LLRTASAADKVVEAKRRRADAAALKETMV